MALRKRTIILSIGLLLMGVACGDDDDTTPTPEAGVDGSPDGDVVGDNTIVAVAAGNPDFSTLVEAVMRADLVDILNGAGPFTVFAPTNDAFTASGITDVNAVEVADLRQILLYHVISGARVESSQVMAGTQDSAAELTLFLGTEGGVTINGGNAIMGGANVVTPDVAADNGIIHAIDRVLLPPDIPTAATYGGLTQLVDAVGAAAPLGDGTAVLAALQSEGPFTVFAPTNQGFMNLPAVPAGEALRDVLLYHVVSGSVASTEIPAKADTLLQNEYGNGVSILFDTTAGVAANGNAVAIADIRCTNGIVHVIGEVLLPPNVVDMATIAGFTSLTDAVGMAANLADGTSVADALTAQAPYTVFAPTNDAFSRAPAGLAPDALRDVLLLHVVDAGAPVLSTGIPATAPALGGMLTFDTAADPPTVAGPGGATGPGTANIVLTDLNVTNGVVHVISEVILP